MDGQPIRTAICITARIFPRPHSAPKCSTAIRPLNSSWIVLGWKTFARLPITNADGLLTLESEQKLIGDRLLAWFRSDPITLQRSIWRFARQISPDPPTAADGLLLTCKYGAALGSIFSI